jgi:hypothetical protein
MRKLLLELLVIGSMLLGGCEKVAPPIKLEKEKKNIPLTLEDPRKFEQPKESPKKESPKQRDYYLESEESALAKLYGLENGEFVTLRNQYESI